MLRPSPNHGTQRLPNDDDDDDPNTSTGKALWNHGTNYQRRWCVPRHVQVSAITTSSFTPSRKSRKGPSRWGFFAIMELRVRVT